MQQVLLHHIHKHNNHQLHQRVFHRQQQHLVERKFLKEKN
jgi:hypothetical protein